MPHPQKLRCIICGRCHIIGGSCCMHAVPASKSPSKHATSSKVILSCSGVESMVPVDGSVSGVSISSPGDDGNPSADVANCDITQIQSNSIPQAVPVADNPSSFCDQVVLALGSSARSKPKRTCGRCGVEGHNKLTCKKRLRNFSLKRWNSATSLPVDPSTFHIECSDSDASHPDSSISNAPVTLPDAPRPLPETTASLHEALASLPNVPASVPDALASLPEALTTFPDALATLTDASPSPTDGTTSLPDALASVSAAPVFLRDATASFTDAATSLHSPTCLPNAPPSLFDQTSLADLSASVFDAPASVLDARAPLPDATASVSDAIISLTDARVVLPVTRAFFPDTTACVPDATACHFDANIVVPDATASLPVATTSVINATASFTDVPAFVSDAMTPVSDASASRPDATASFPDASVPSSSLSDSSLPDPWQPVRSEHVLHCSICGAAGHRRTSCPVSHTLAADARRSLRRNRNSPDVLHVAEVPASPLSQLHVNGTPERECVSSPHFRLYSPFVPSPTISSCELNESISDVGGNDSNISVESDLEIDQCSWCCRVEVRNYPLNLQTVDANFVCRNFGIRRRIEDDSLVCSLCQKYLARTNKSPEWAEAWPSVYYSFLTRPGLVVDSIRFIQSFPSNFRRMWRKCGNVVIPEIKALWQTPSLFVDVTGKLNRFRQRWVAPEARAFRSLNATACPQVLCPMGCHLYKDGTPDDEVSFLQSKHYCLLFSKPFSFFDSSARYFDGARPDWPTQILSLGKWTVSPTLYCDAKKGLCIITCGPSIHSDGRHRYVSVPRHPIWGSVSPIRHDPTAPVTANPRLLKGGSCNKMNTSYVVLKQMGGASGVSTFNLSVKPQDFDTIPKQKDFDSWGLTLINRPEVHEALSNSSNLKKQFCKDILDRSNPLPEETVADHVATGSYVAFGDACHLFKSYESRFNSSETDADQSATAAKGKHLEIHNVCHPADNFGQKPFVLNKIVKAMGREPGGSSIFLLLHMLIHCRALYRAFLAEKWSRVNNALMTDLLSICQSIQSGRINVKLVHSKAIRLEEQLVALAVQTDHISLHDRSEKLVQHILKIIIPSVKVISLGEDADQLDLLEAVFGVTDDIILIDSSASPLGDVRENVDRDRLSLLLAAHIQLGEGHQYVPYFNFRWLPSSRWYCLQNSPLFGRSDALVDQSWSLLVYCSRATEETINKNQYLNLSGGQSKLLCKNHPMHFLAKEHSGTGWLCGVPLCKAQIRFRCCHNLNTHGQCLVSLCQKHAKQELLKEGSTSVSTIAQPPACLPRRTVSETLPLSPESPVSIESEDPLAPIYDSHAAALVEAVDVPLSTPWHEKASFASCSSNISGHFLLKDHLRCYSRVGNSRKPPVRFQQLLQFLHSIAPENSLPLLYPEGLLFPEIFFKSIQGAVVGALPSLLFSEYGHRAVKGGLASLHDHLQVRLRDLSSLTSSNESYISFCFDVILNHLLRHNSVRVAMHKGLEHITRPAVQFANRDAVIPFDEGNAGPQVKRLAAFMRDTPWTYFLTITCNESDTCGVRPLKKAVIKMYENEILTENVELHLQNLCVLTCMAWARFIRYFFLFLENGPEQVLGKILTWWLRFEFQDEGSIGNRPHVHAGISLDPTDLDPSEVSNRVHNRLPDFFHELSRTDRASLTVDGLVKDTNDYNHLTDLYFMLTTHSCARGKGKCMKKRADGSNTCRVPRHPVSGFHTFVRNDSLYTEEFMVLLETLELANRNDWGDLKVIDPLVGGQHHYPTLEMDEGIVSVPSNGRLFAICRSMVNLQVCDNHFSVAYLAKYAAGKDAKRDVAFTSTSAGDLVDLDAYNLYNEKIPGASYAEMRERNKQNAAEPLARELSLCEMIWFSLRLKYVLSNVENVEVQTKAPEYRCAVFKYKTGPNRKMIDPDGNLRVVQLRAPLPAWRQFTASQQLMIRDVAVGCYHPDRTTAFSLRPPELLLVDNLRQYSQWFVSAPSKNLFVAANIESSPWLDGRGHVIRIRFCYLDDVWEHFHSIVEADNASLVARATQMLHLLEVLCQDVHQPQYSEVFHRFVDVDKTKRVVVSFSAVTPLRFDSFLVHMLLSMGKFQTEHDVYSCHNRVEALQHVGLIEDAATAGEVEARSLARQYIMEQLRFFAVGAKMFQRLVFALVDNLSRLFRGADALQEALPLSTLRAITEVAAGKLKQVEDTLHNNLVDALLLQNLPGLPEQAVLRSRIPFRYNPVLDVMVGQRIESHREQTSALCEVCKSIDELLRPGRTFVRSPILLGPPGAGKTHILLTATLYALSKGLRAMLVSVTSERARVLGGEHMHLLFGIPVQKSALETAQIVAEKCLLALANSPIKRAFLKRLDVIVFEEIGLLSLQHLVALDVVLREIRDHCVPFGGVLIIASGDSRQLPPVEHEPIWRGQLLLDCCKIMLLEHYVRCRADVDLQTVLVLMRKPTLSEAECTQVLRIFKRRCYPQHFVGSWDDVPPASIRVVSKRAAEKEAISYFIAQQLSNSNLVHGTYRAVDTVETVSGNWGPADARVSKHLDRKLLEVYDLLLFEGAVMRVTYNNSIVRRELCCFSQGQIVVIIQLPDASAPRNLQRIRVKVVPPGVRDVDPTNLPTGWPIIALSLRVSEPSVVGRGMTKGRREQWPLRHSVATTIHKVIGETCHFVATKISSNDPNYSFWLREQFLTLVSRVRSLDDITFVGDATDTFTAIEALLKIVNPSDEHVDKLLKQLDVLHHSSRVVPYEFSELTSLNCELLPSACGFVFLAVSAKFTHRSIIDETATLSKALYRLNSSVGDPDNNEARPWVLMAYVSGFSGLAKHPENVQERKDFKMIWERADIEDGPFTHPRQLLRSGVRVFQEFRINNPEMTKLIFVQCCTFENSPPEIVPPAPVIDRSTILMTTMCRHTEPIVTVIHAADDSDLPSFETAVTITDRVPEIPMDEATFEGTATASVPTHLDDSFLLEDRISIFSVSPHSSYGNGSDDAHLFEPSSPYRSDGITLQIVDSNSEPVITALEPADDCNLRLSEASLPDIVIAAPPLATLGFSHPSPLPINRNFRSIPYVVDQSFKPAKVASTSLVPGSTGPDTGSVKRLLTGQPKPPQLNWEPDVDAGDGFDASDIQKATKLSLLHRRGATFVAAPQLTNSQLEQRISRGSEAGSSGLLRRAVILPPPCYSSDDEDYITIIR